MPRTSFKFRAAVVLAVWLLTSAAHAAQQRSEAEQEEALTHLEAVFEQHQISVLEQAATDRFALVYAQQADGSAVTVTLRQLPQQTEFLDLTIATDSPHDPALERRLIQALRKAQSNNEDD